MLLLNADLSRDMLYKNGMNLKHLKYFIAIAETGNLAQAARSLNMSASPLSRRLRELEKEVGLVLIDRSNGMTLTNEGHRLLEIARRINSLASEIVSLAGPLHRPKTAISIGLRSVHPRLRQALIEAASGVQSEVPPILRPMVPNDQLLAISEGTLDFGTIRTWPVEQAPQLSGIPVLIEELGFAVPDRSPFSEKLELGLEDIQGLKLISHYAPMHPVLDEFLKKGAKPVQLDPYVAGGAAALIAQGDHFTVVPIDRAAPARRSIDEPGILFRRLRNGPYSYITYLVWRSDRGDADLAKYVAAFKREWSKPETI